MDCLRMILAFVLLLIAPFVVAGLWCWVKFWVAVGILLVIAEVISSIKTGKTISRRFWEWRDKAKGWQKILIGVGMSLFWVYLLLHLYLGW